MAVQFRVNKARLKQDIHTLAKMTDKAYPGYTRMPFTKEYKASRTWLRSEMESCGLEVSNDAASNLIGKRAGKKAHLPPIMIGSHTDSVIGGGRFDGIIGVLAGIEIVRQLNEANIELEHSLHIVDFTAEEASDFGISTIGSRGMVGNLTEELLSQKNANGLTLRNGIELFGGRPNDLEKESLERGSLTLYLELHIEQGPVLEQSANELGAVTGIVGIYRHRIVVKGQPNHAGTTPMNMRFDALTTASELILSIESIANQTYGDPVVGTVGRIDCQPNGSNVIPGEVTFDFELRSININALDHMVTQIREAVNRVTEKRNIDILMEKISISEPVKIEQKVLDVIKTSCESIGKTIELPSGAGHDGNQLAQVAPVGMIFVPSKDGKSHCPEEWTDYGEVAKGVQALGSALIHFDKNLA